VGLGGGVGVGVGLGGGVGVGTTELTGPGPPSSWCTSSPGWSCGGALVSGKEGMDPPVSVIFTFPETGVGERTTSLPFVPGTVKGVPPSSFIPGTVTFI
jgi:hypothetical protein